MPSVVAASENGRKSFDVPLRDQGGSPRDCESPSRLPDLEPDHGLCAPVAEEEVAAILGGEPVLVVANALGPRPAELAGHDRQAAERCGQELVRISVMAADDVMRQAVGPLLAVVVVAVGEDLAGRAEGDRERIPLARRDHLQAGPVGPDPDHPAALEPDRPPVLAPPARNALVAHGDVEESVHPQADPGGDVVIDAARTGDVRTEARDQVDPLVGTAISVGVAEGRQVGRRARRRAYRRPIPGPSRSRACRRRR